MKISELDEKLTDVVVPVTMQQQALHIPDFTPGDVHHLRLTPYSPYDIPGKYRQNLRISLTPPILWYPTNPSPQLYYGIPNTLFPQLSYLVQNNYP